VISGELVEGQNIFFVKLSTSGWVKSCMWKPSVLDIIMCAGSVKYCVVFVGNEPIKIHEQ
jgi:hypothetical protein